MSEIVRRAGGSLATLYNQFGDKQGIFLAMLDARVQFLADAMLVELQNHASLEDDLLRMGQQYGEQLVLPESLEIYRLVVGVAKKFPEVAHSFSQKGPNRARRVLADYFRERAADGEIVELDYDASAGLFLDMVRAGIQNKALIDPCHTITKEEVRKSVALATQIFLNGILPRGKE